MATITMYVPTAADVAAVEIGSFAPGAFGRMEVVTDVTARGQDRKGAAFVCYRVAFGDNGATMSGSIKAGELDRNTASSRYFTSAQLDAIERDMNAKGERERVIEI